MGRTKQPLLCDLGGTGIKRYGPVLRDEWHPDLGVLTTKYKIYRQMLDNDGLMSGAFAMMSMLMSQARWSIQVPPDVEASPEHHRWADFAESCRADMVSSWPEVLMSALTSMPYGFSLLWESFKIRRGDRPERVLNSRHNDGLVGWRDLQPRAQSTIREWYFDYDSCVTGVKQHREDGFPDVDLPIDRLWHVRIWPDRGNPEGRAMLRAVYRNWHFRSRLEEVEAIGFHRDLNGYPALQVPPQILDPYPTTKAAAIRASLEDKIRNIRRDNLEGVLIPCETDATGKPTGYKLELLGGPGRGFADINNSIIRHRSEQMVALFSEIQIMGLNAVGTQALSKDKREILEVALGAIMDSVCETFNRQTLRRLMEINNVPQQYWPVLTHGDIDEPDVVQIVDAFGRALQSGAVVPSLGDERHLRDLLDWPQRNPEDELMPAPTGDQLLDLGTGLAEANQQAQQAQQESAPVQGQPQVEPETKSAFESDGPFIDDVTAAETLGVPLNTIRRAVRTGKLPGNRVGRNYRLNRDDVDRFFRGKP